MDISSSYTQTIPDPFVTNSAFSGTNDDDTQWSGCLAGQTITSCGISTLSNSARIDGTQVLNGACVVQNGFGGPGVSAYAACNSLSSLTCNAVGGPLSSTANDAPSEVSCGTDQIMVSCGAFASYASIDGAYIGDVYTPTDIDSSTKCIAYNSGNSYPAGGGGVYAKGMCCNKFHDNGYELKCHTKWGSAVSNGYSLVACDGGESLLGCSGYSPYSDTLSSYFIDGDNLCKAQAGINAAQAVATCCILEKDPTQQPTAQPTQSPTAESSYIVGPERVSWSDAKTYCESVGTSLASIHSIEDQNEAISICSPQADGSTILDGCWIGLSDDINPGTYVYADNTKTEYGFTNSDPSSPTTGITPWQAGEPNDLVTEHCIQMLEDYQFKWNDKSCDHLNFPLCNGGSCQYDVNYFIVGQPCIVSGDPHFVLWNGNNHDFQGQPDLGKQQFYYIHPCAGKSKDHMPFGIMGTHYKVGESSVSGLDYITIELYDNDQNEYLIWLSSSIHHYINKTEAVNTLYDDNINSGGVDLDSGIETVIGNKFKILYTQTSTRIDVILTVDNECTVELYMQSQGNYVSGRNRMHYLQITPPKCYKCFTCGLCGDFQSATSGNEYEQLATTDGGYMPYRAGWGSDIIEAYDVNGMTWEQSYVETNWIDVNEIIDPNVVYEADEGTQFVYEDPCNDINIANAVIAECQSQRDLEVVCCNLIGGNYCDQLQDFCNTDACLAVNGNATAISSTVYQLLNEPIQLVCNIPDIGDQFNETNTDPSPNADTSHPTPSPTYVPTGTPSKTPTVIPTDIPSKTPTGTPSKTPTVIPTDSPSKTPTNMPTIEPTEMFYVVSETDIHSTEIDTPSPTTEFEGTQADSVISLSLYINIMFGAVFLLLFRAF